jgi:hypothetical protein
VAERGFLAGALDLDELALAGHDDVEVDLGVLVLDIREVEERAVPEHAHADGGDRVGERALGDPLGVDQLLDREPGGE